MNADQVRRSFVDYFVEREHRSHASSPLVPRGDATLLFTNAGMVQFKDYFLGTDEPPAKRAVSVQKCLRVSGKHNDLENVGPSHRHHTFFEMLGNFSFGDYFKQEAIRFGWELVTEVWGLPPERLFATVFEEDEDAARLWTGETPLPAERVLRCGAKDNFWAMGDTGPCGPCSEIFVDLYPDRPQVDFHEGADSGRYLEIWNLVFMQFQRREDGTTEDLPNPSIDTGAGLERVTAVLQGVESNYDTDLFQPILAAAAAAAGARYGEASDADVDYRVIADHLRAITFLLADGVIPGNEGRGYVLRRLLRRALRHGMRRGLEEPFLHRLLPVVDEVMGVQYPELAKVERASAATVAGEEEKFLQTLAAGSAQVQEAIEEGRRAGRSRLSGEEAFRFYDTHGLPLEVIREIAEEERFAVDEEGFERALEDQRRRSRAAAAGAGSLFDAAREALREGGKLAASEFVGYDELSLSGARIAALARQRGGGVEPVERLAPGERGIAVLDRTPFYAEAGGQLGDRGTLAGGDGLAARVEDTQKDDAGIYYHLIEVESGELRVGGEVRARVGDDWRRPTERNHTATHLLHAALRYVLGEGVRQAGSLVAPDRLRFDFTHPRPLTGEELARVEELVNAWILRAEETRITAGRSYEEAVAAGAMALFGEKYGDRVRTVEVPGFVPSDEDPAIASLELCGGCHVANTGAIGQLLIVSERGVAAGVRRIEALTGEGARRAQRRHAELLDEVAAELGVQPDRAPAEIGTLRRRARELERELAKLRMALVTDGGEAGSEVEVAGVKVLVREVPTAPAGEIRGMADRLRGRLGSGVVVLGSREEGKVSLVTAVSEDLTDRLHAGNLAARIAALVDGRGGGRPDFAQAGGRRPENLPKALEAVAGYVREELGAA